MRCEVVEGSRVCKFRSHIFYMAPYNLGYNEHLTAKVSEYDASGEETSTGSAGVKINAIDLFSFVDANNDNYISLMEFMGPYRAMDLNLDGKITLEEIHEWFNTPERRQRMMERNCPEALNN